MLKGWPVERPPPVQDVSVKELQRKTLPRWLPRHLSDAHQASPHRLGSDTVQGPGLRSALLLMVIFSTHDDIASIKQSRPYLIIAQYGVDLVPIFLRDRNPLLLLLLLLLLCLVSLKAAMSFLPIVDHDEVTSGYSR
jgi:hypothetical protein